MRAKRDLVLEALAASPLPASANDLARALGGACDAATVYRALHRLEAEGKAESFAFECAERGIERYYLARVEAPHRHFFHCESCHRFLDLGACRLASLVAEVEAETGAKVEGHSLTFTGTCRDCRARGAGA